MTIFSITDRFPLHLPILNRSKRHLLIVYALSLYSYHLPFSLREREKERRTVKSRFRTLKSSNVLYYTYEKYGKMKVRKKGGYESKGKEGLPFFKIDIEMTRCDVKRSDSEELSSLMSH